jgi:hypothetical protein
VLITENAESDRFVVDYNEEQVTVRLRPGCTGWIHVLLGDTPVGDMSFEYLEFTVMHDGDTCPLHEDKQ